MFFRGMDLNEDARNYLEKHSDIVDNCLFSYMQNICSGLSKLLEENLKKIEIFSSEKNEDEPLIHTARVHFRGYNVERMSMNHYAWEIWEPGQATK